MSAGAPLHVAAAVLYGADGRVLLSRRTEGRDLAGLWEFPGGKCEPGEPAAEALVRELHEELGLEVSSSDCEPLIAVPFAYADKRILLDVFTVRQWQGEPRGLERQALAWTPLERLARYRMPPADLPVAAALRDPAIYLITPEPEPGREEGFLAAVDAALAGGARRVQLRARRQSAEALLPLAAQVAARCREAGAELLVNGHPEIAQALGVGLHLRASQLMAHRDRRPLPEGLPLAASCHDAAELVLAEACGVDFVVLGPVAPTASHPDATPLGWEGFARLRESSPLPIYALGGLSGADLGDARRHGAQGVAGIGAFWPAVGPD